MIPQLFVEILDATDVGRKAFVALSTH